jgi:hypothetical protein
MSSELTTNLFHLIPHFVDLLRFTVHHFTQFHQVIYFFDTVLVWYLEQILSSTSTSYI